MDISISAFAALLGAAIGGLVVLALAGLGAGRRWRRGKAGRG